MNVFSFGFSENIGPKERHKFDCIQFNDGLTRFALCDGANSTPWGAYAAELAAATLVLPFDPSKDVEQAMKESFFQAK